MSIYLEKFKRFCKSSRVVITDALGEGSLGDLPEVRHKEEVKTMIPIKLDFSLKTSTCDKKIKRSRQYTEGEMMYPDLG